MRKLTLSLAVMAALLPVRGYSLGLGELELNSALNQELNAEIEVFSAASEDAEQLIVKLANREAFNRAGLDRPFLLQQLKFKLIDKEGKPYVKVYSKMPIREPYLSFLLEVDWPQGHLLREYTLLLDPPVYNTGENASQATSSSFNEPAAEQAQTQPVSSHQQSAHATHSGGSVVQTGVISSDSGRSVNYQSQALPVANTTAQEYRVQRNDTLWGIANRMRPDSSVSVEQMMIALVRKNPEAFIRENINGVKRGYILRAPSREEATQISRSEAVAKARDHSALWREYSQNASRNAPASSLEAEHKMPTGEAADQAHDADGHLSIVGASEHGSEHAGSNQDPNAELTKIKQELAMANEQLESERLEKEQLRSRLAELEERVQSVIQMDDEQLAQLQQDLAPQAEEQQEATPAEAPEQSPEQSPEQAAESITPDDAMPDVMAEDGATGETSVEATVEPETTEAEVVVEEDIVFVDEAGVEQAEVVVEEVLEVQEPAPAPTVEAIEPPAFAQKKPKSFFDNLFNDPTLLGMIGGGAAFIGLLIALLIRRIRGKKEEEWTSELEDPAQMDLSDLDAELDSGLDAGLDDATVKTQAADFDSESTAEMAVADEDSMGMNDTQIDVPDDDENLEDTVFHLDGDEPEEEEDDRDDVLAEADVYLAYGIYQQAEELLTSAIDQNPDRDDYRMKLLETHYASKNTAAFEQLAEDVKSRGSEKSYWDRVVAMGMEICPDSTLFSGEVMADFDPEALLPDKPQTTDLELDAGDESTDFDLGLDDTELDLSSDEDDAEKTQLLSEPLDLDDIDLGDIDQGDIDQGDINQGDELETDFGGLDDLPESESAETDTSSDLELDLGEMSGFDDAELSGEDTQTAAESTDLDIDEDFSLDFDAADLGLEESGEESLDADLDLGSDLDLDSAEEEIGIDLSEDLAGDLDADLGEMNLDDTDSAEGDDSDELDLGDLDLSDSIDLDDGDLNGAEEEPTSDEAESMDVSLDDTNEFDAAESLSDDDEEEFDLSELSDDIDEVGTKLDLAKAYIDMGDNDGARSILEEVKAEGNEEQQKQADELIQQAS